jgi:ATP-dependent Clp protease adaptor protein ClpS
MKQSKSNPFRLSTDDGDKRPEHKGGLAVKERPKTKRPPMFRVLLHNDDFTSMEFVVFLLESVFHHDHAGATRVMLHVHNSGVGVAGVYTREIAESKVQKSIAIAKQAEFPLQCTSEEA